MTIREMHYDYKQKLNKIDSQQYRNLRVPEIDWKLNEAIGLFIKIVAEPKHESMLGFEKSQRTIDDIRTLVVNQEELLLTPNTLDDTVIATLPTDYHYFVGVDKLLIEKGPCTVRAEKIYVRQHDDDFELSPFDKSSFKWREANITFYEEGIRIFTGGEFTVQAFSINYIKEHPFVYNATDFTGGTYNDLNGNALTGTQDCILPSQTHSEIVDIAVAITTGDLQMPDIQTKFGKLGLNQIT